jgi:hypothetical protein
MSSADDVINWVEARRFVTSVSIGLFLSLGVASSNWSYNSVEGVDIPDSKVPSDQAIDSPSESPDERGDCDCEWTDRFDGDMLPWGMVTGSVGIGLSGCDVAETGICLWV